MKDLYLTVAVISLLMGVLNMFVTYAPPHGSNSAFWIANNLDSWSIHEGSVKNSYLESKDIKEETAKYIKSFSGIEYKIAQTFSNFLFILSALCFLGYFRERKFKSALIANKA